MNESFNLRRLGLLMRADLVADYRPLAITCAGIAALMCVASMLNVLQNNQSDTYYVSWYAGMLFLWAPIVASFSFRELHDKTRNEAYLLLPASALEKTVARLLRTTIALFAFILVFLTVTSTVIESINWLVFGRRNGLFAPFDRAVWQLVGHALVAVSLYFLGAAWFRRLHFIKTMLTLSALPLALGCFAVFTVWVVFGGDASIDIGEREGYNFYLAHRGAFDALLGLALIVYFAVIPVFCWVVAWLRVKETQVSYGV